MIKIKKYNESGDSIVEVIEFDTVEEYIEYCDYHNEGGKLDPAGHFTEHGEWVITKQVAP